MFVATSFYQRPASRVYFFAFFNLRNLLYLICPNLCDGQYCEKHRTEERRKYDMFERSLDINRKYGRAWKRIRDRYAAEHPLCETCLKEGRLTPVQEVHHILPVSKGGTHARDNLMSLCQSCHTKIHHDIGDR